MAVGVTGATGAHGHQQLLAGQGLTGRSVGPAVEEHVVEPLLEQCGGGVPVHGELEDDPVGGLQGGLLGGDVDLLVGVEVVHVAHGDVVSEGLGLGRQGPVGARGGHVGVEDENEGLHECSCCQTMMVGCAARLRAPGAP